MALKIFKLKDRPQAQKDQFALWQEIAKYDVVHRYINDRHPYLTFWPIDLSESLTLAIAFGRIEAGQTFLDLPYVIGTVYLKDLRPGYAQEPDVKRFKLGFSSMLRSLLFFEMHKQNYLDFSEITIVNDDMTLNVEKIEKFVNLITENLPFDISVKEETLADENGDEVVRDTIHFKAHNENLLMPSLSLPKYHDETSSHDMINRVNMVEKKNLMFAITRAFMNIKTVDAMREFILSAKEQNEQREKNKGIFEYAKMKAQMQEVSDAIIYGLGNGEAHLDREDKPFQDLGREKWPGIKSSEVPDSKSDTLQE